ncbi:MAG: hypothetical protein ABSH53_06335 [Holophaga sp.]|jgi:hypothetical protein
MSLVLEPQLSLSLTFAEQLERSLRGAARATGAESLLRDADALRAQIHIQFPELAADDDPGPS